VTTLADVLEVIIAERARAVPRRAELQGLRRLSISQPAVRSLEQPTQGRLLLAEVDLG